MAAVTGLTAARMQEIINDQMASASVVGDNLVIVKNDGSAINAGNVRGAKGDTGTLAGMAGVKTRCTTADAVAAPPSGFAFHLGQVVLNIQEFSTDETILYWNGPGAGRIQVLEGGLYAVEGNVSVNFTSGNTVRTAQMRAEIGIGGDPADSGDVVSGNTVNFDTSLSQTLVSTVSGIFNLPADAFLELDYYYGFQHTLHNELGHNIMSVHRVG
jgi:hypothetical protein